MTDHRWEQVSRLYHAVLARDESRRAEFLGEACGEDDELRREVESLLAQEQSAEGFLSTPAVEMAAKVMAQDGSQPGMWGLESGIDLVGSQIGGYQILSRLGAGGMGEVYRARDSKLGRDVAIKVLPSLFATDAERLRRFEREARLLASLNHPHIGAIYGVEDAPADAGSPIRALIMELVDGPTMADRLTRGPVPIKEALKIGQQIAEALEAAHEKGIIHRDLKPANIMLTRDGDAKVLDFGLAKAFAGNGSTLDLSHVPTVTDTELRPGAILGTPAYMSPEQARGQAIDKRTDIWAFGCVLYEMLTGRTAFPGETISDTIAVILEREPAWTALPQSTPAPVRRLLAQCLDKDPKRRLRDIGQARIELDDAIAQPPARDTRSDVAVPTPLWRRSAPAVGLVLLLLAGGAGLFYWVYSAKSAAPATPPSEYTQITNFTDSASAPSLSPDGRMVTFIRGGEAFLSRGQIYVKLLPNGESVRLTTDANRKFAPVFTPDGSRIAYSLVSPGPPLSWDTFTVPVLGGQPTRLLPNATGLTWLDDQHVLFSENRLPGLHMGIVTATEGRAQSREIYFPTHVRGMAHYAYASPDRKSVLVVEMDRTHIFTSPCRLVPFDGSSMGRTVGPPGSCTSAAWSPDGQWMYFGAAVGGSSHLWRQRFPDGVPEQITFGPNEQEGVTVAPDGRSLITSVGLRRSSFWIHDAAGERALSSEGFAGAPRLSGDGSRVFYLFMRDLEAVSAELRSLDLASGTSDSLVPGMSVNDFDISRDETEVAFTTTDGAGESTIWLASLDRRRAPRLIARAGDQVSFGANGDLIFRSLEETTNLLVRIEKDGTGREQIATPSILDKFSVSPDGEWVTLFSPDAGEDGSPATVAVPVRGGAFRRICAYQCPVFWSSDGRIFYIAIDRSTLWAPRASWARSAPFVGRTLAIPVPVGQSLPNLPAAGLRLAEEAALPGLRVIEHGAISPGSDPSTYVFTKTDLQRNLFRIPLD